MVRPHHEAQKANGDGGPGDGGVAEDRLAREDRQHLLNHAEGRQDEDVDFGMAEEPEEVLPEQWVAAGGGLREGRAPGSIEEKQETGGRQAGARERAGGG